jgi:predicted dehydrogenase
MGGVWTVSEVFSTTGVYVRPTASRTTDSHRPLSTCTSNGSVQVIRDDIAAFRGVSEGDVVRYAIAKPEPLRVEHENFRDAVLGKDADIVTLEQAMATVVVAEAVIQSALTGKTVDLA